MTAGARGLAFVWGRPATVTGLAVGGGIDVRAGGWCSGQAFIHKQTFRRLRALTVNRPCRTDNSSSSHTHVPFRGQCQFNQNDGAVSLQFPKVRHRSALSVIRHQLLCSASSHKPPTYIPRPDDPPATSSTILARKPPWTMRNLTRRHGLTLQGQAPPGPTKWARSRRCGAASAPALQGSAAGVFHPVAARTFWWLAVARRQDVMAAFLPPPTLMRRGGEIEGWLRKTGLLQPFPPSGFLAFLHDVRPPRLSPPFLRICLIH